MASHGYDDEDFDIVDANQWNQYDSYAMRRAPPADTDSHDATNDHKGSSSI